MAVCARCAAPLVATARFCAACGSPVLLNTTPPPQSRPDSRGPTEAMPAVPAPDPFARTVMGDPAAAAAAATAAAAADALASQPKVPAAAGASQPRVPTAPIAIGVAPARPNPVSPMASSVMRTPGDPAPPQAGAQPPWNAGVPPAQTPVPYSPPPAAVNPYMPGTMVLVHWSNGNRYPGTILQVSGAQVLVAFPNGQQHWVDVRYVSSGG